MNNFYIRHAASTENKKNVPFYKCYRKIKKDKEGKMPVVGTGSTLLKDKIILNRNKDKFIYVDIIDFSEYIIDNFKIA